MRRGLCVLALLLACGWAGSVLGDAVVLKDGQVFDLAKPYVKKGSVAILTLKDGAVRSVRLSEIDLAKTAAANVPVVAAAPDATPAKPKSLAEAAQSKGQRRASVSLTDQDVARGMTSEGAAENRAQGAGDVDITGVSSSKTKTGYSFTGSVVNRGKIEAQGVSVTIEVIGDENKTLTTAFAQVAKSTLAPGETAGFQAEVALEVEPRTFRYVPTWKVVVPASEAQEGGRSASGSSGAQGSQANSAEPEATPTPAPTPPPPAPTPKPRGDVAPPMANAPYGEPTSPGQPYVPGRPSENPK
jgi:hypothetical protein